MTTRPDPFLAAGVLCCPTCRGQGHPTGASWVDDDLILATFASPCEHHGESTQLVVPSLIAAATGRCFGVTAAGTWCRNRARRGGRYCGAHDRQDADRGAR